jgi:hypothetical protein
MSAYDPKRILANSRFQYPGLTRYDALFRTSGDAMKRREFIILLGGAATALPLEGRAQPATTPLIGFLSSRSPNESEALVAAFRQGLAEAGYAEGQNVHLAFR